MKARWNNMTMRDRIINVLIIVLSVAVIAVIPHTEKALRNTFDKAGNRKETVSC